MGMPSLRWASGQGAFRVPPAPPCRSSGSALFRRCGAAPSSVSKYGYAPPSPAMLLLYATIHRRPCSCRLHIFPVFPLRGRPALWFCIESVLAGVLSRCVSATPTALPGPFRRFRQCCQYVHIRAPLQKIFKADCLCGGVPPGPPVFCGDNFQFQDSVKFPDNAVSVRRAAKPTLPVRFLLANSAIFFSQSAIPMPVVPRSSATICAAAGCPFRMSGKLLAYAPGGRSCSGFLLLCFDKA